MQYVAVTRAELSTVLRDVGIAVDNADSFEGSLEYTALEGPPCGVCHGERGHQLGCDNCEGVGVEPLPEGKDFWVRGVYRVGNSMGQGGVRILGEVVRND